MDGRGWDLFVGIEGDVTAGIQGGFSGAHFIGIDVNVASVVLAEGSVNNIEGGKGRLIQSDNFKIKQGVSAAYIVGAGYTHTFDVINGIPRNEEHEIKIGVAFFGATLKYDSNWNFKNAFIGFDGFVGGAFLLGGNGALKIGGYYKPE